MKKVFTEFKVIVKSSFSCSCPITEKRTSSEQEALNTARELSALYPASQIIIEEWKFLQSRKPFKSGYYRSRTIYYSQEAAS